ncbi:MAG TPA: BON domain-containing protein [Burkholderiaceae bacterium]|nr:BON domain-containing protein [Burkholderiaceae bacterium]
MKLARTLVAAALVASVLPACAPLVIGTIAAGTAIVATDRRTTGTQVDDTSIELRVSSELGTAFKDIQKEVHISVNSFERKVLLTGEVPTGQAKAQAGEIASRSLNVRTVVNELTIAPPSTFGQRTNDTTIGTKVRAQFVNTKEIPFNSVGIVTERGIVYLMGFVTEKEGEIAAHVASRVTGVQQVVKVFDYGTQEEVQRRRGVSSQPAAPTTSASPATSAPPATTGGTAR